MNSREIIRILKQSGWALERTRGSHHVFLQPGTGRIAIAPHPKRDLPIGTVKAIERQTGIKFLK